MSLYVELNAWKTYDTLNKQCYFVMIFTRIGQIKILNWEGHHIEEWELFNSNHSILKQLCCKQWIQSLRWSDISEQIAGN